MRTIIVGGGKIGYNLFKTLVERHRDVVLIEKDRDTCTRIAEDINGTVLCGDGTDIDVLEDADIKNADIIAAVTGSDEENLIICQIAKLSFSSMRTIARVNNPKNTVMFKNLGIDNTVCSTEVIANLIEYSLNNQDYRIVSMIGKGPTILAELNIKEHHPWIQKQVHELKLPHECVLVSVLRDDLIIYPRGNTEILIHDKVIVVTNNSALSQIVDELYTRSWPSWKK